MLKRVVLSTLAAALAASPAGAQDLGALEEQFALFAAEDVVVSASKHKQKASEAPSAIYVITAREIESAAALTLSDLLRRVPGMDVYRVSQGYTIIGARGLATESNNLILVLLDGREVNVELFGIPFIEQIPVTQQEIDRIEVIRGPGSALYGANAFSGVVNIITRTPETQRTYEGMVAGGNYGNAHLSALAMGNVDEKYGYSVSARYRTANAFSDSSENSMQSASARTLFTYRIADDSAVTADFSVDNSRTEIFTTIGELPAELLQTGARLSYDKGNFKTDVFWNVLDEQLAVEDPALNPTQAPSSDRILTNLNGIANTFDLESRYAFESGEINRLIVGGNVRWNSFNSDILTDPYSNEYRFGLYLQDELRPIENLILSAGARLDYYLFESPLCGEGATATNVTCSGEFQSVDPAISPRGSVVWTPIDNNTFRVSYGQAFRKPAFFERQIQVRALEQLNLNFANPELPNEKVTAYELGYAARFGERVKVNADLFYNQYENFIVFQANQVRFDIQREDGRPVKVNAYGGELSTKIVFTEGLEGSASYAYLAKDPDDEADPMHKLNGELTWRADFGLIANVFAGYISQREWRISDPTRGNFFVPFTAGQSLGNYVVLDARLGYRFWNNQLEVGIIGKNLVEEHREFPGLSEVDIDGDPLTATENYGGEPIKRLAFLYLEGTF